MKSHRPLKPYHPILIVLLSLSFNTWGLGVGDIQVNSHLGQPLQAQFQLTDTDDLNQEQIIVRLAPPGMFKKMDVDRTYDVLSIQFEVNEDRTVSLKTSRPIKEPFLNFIVEVVWPEGKVLREYKVFLDPV